jgi:hypothetical protein
MAGRRGGAATEHFVIGMGPEDQDRHSLLWYQRAPRDTAARTLRGVLRVDKA